MRAGRANAASGRIMVTVPGDHFGPIPPEADPRGLVCTEIALPYLVRLKSAAPMLRPRFQLMQPGESIVLNLLSKCKVACFQSTGKRQC